MARPRDTMLTALRSAEAGVGSDLLGRLGHLGGIDKKFDVAVSTACPALTYLVTETVDGAQKCVTFYAPTILVALLSSYLENSISANAKMDAFHLHLKTGGEQD